MLNNLACDAAIPIVRTPYISVFISLYMLYIGIFNENFSILKHIVYISLQNFYFII